MSKRWTFEEDQIILNSIDDIDVVYDQLPNRSIASIKSRANILKREKEKRKFIESWDRILYSDIVGYDAEVPENFKDNFDRVCEMIKAENRRYERGLSVLIMFYKEGLSYKEICNRTKINIKCIKQVHNKYLRMLRHPAYKYILDHGESKPNEEQLSNDTFDDRIESINLTARAYDVLKKGGIDTITQLMSMDDSDLRKLKNMNMIILNDIKKIRSFQWTFAEDKIIMDNYDTIGIKVCEQLPGRTAESVKARASYLKRKEEKRKKSIEEWDRILYSDISGPDAELPENFKENFNKVCDMIIRENIKHERNISVITMHYKEGLSYDEIGHIIGAGNARVGLIINKYLGMLRHPAYKYILDHGEYNESCEDPFINEIKSLYISNRVYNILRRGGISTVDQLASMSINDIMHIRNMGKKAFDEIVNALSKRGIKLQD